MREHRRRGSRPTAARRGRRSRARRAATTIRTAGSTRTIPNIILLVADQGAVVTLNGGETWSSWYNQPTAQLYHVTTDNAFPYRVCGGQQESGSACVAEPRQRRRRSRSATGIPVGVEEYGYVGARSAESRHRLRRRSVTRFDRRTGQVSNVGPVPADVAAAAGAGTPAYRTGAHAAGRLLAGRQAHAVLREQRPVEDDRRRRSRWTRISPDLTRADVRAAGERRQVRGSVAASPQRGVIYTIAPSYRRRQPHLGRHRRRRHPRRPPTAARTWKDVTPPRLKPWAKVFNHRRGPLRRADRVRGGQHAAARRHAPAHLPHARRRQDVDGDRQRHPGRRGRPTRCARIRRTQGPALRRHRARGLRLVRRRRSLAVAAAQHGRRRRCATSSSRTTTSSRRRTGAASGSSTTSRRCGRSSAKAPLDGRSAVLFKPPTAWRVRWNTNTDTPLAAGGAGGAESARGRHHRLLPASRQAIGAGDAGDRRSRTAGSCADTRARIRSRAFPIRRTRRCRCTGSARRRCSRPRRACTASPGTCTISRCRSAGGGGSGRRPADCGDSRQHGAGADDAVGVAGDLHGEADGEREDVTRSRSS